MPTIVHIAEGILPLTLFWETPRSKFCILVNDHGLVNSLHSNTFKFFFIRDAGIFKVAKFFEFGVYFTCILQIFYRWIIITNTYAWFESFFSMNLMMQKPNCRRLTYSFRIVLTLPISSSATS